MFHCNKIREEDASVQRFFYRKEGEEEPTTFALRVRFNLFTKQHTICEEPQREKMDERLSTSCDVDY